MLNFGEWNIDYTKSSCNEYPVIFSITFLIWYRDKKKYLKDKAWPSYNKNGRSIAMNSSMKKLPSTI